MSQNDTSGDESGLNTPIFLRKGSRCSRGTPSSVSSSVIFGSIPEEVLRVWSQLPEAIRLDPSLAAYQREYDRVNQTINGKPSVDVKRDCLVVNMSLGTHPRLRLKNDDEGKQDTGAQDHENSPEHKQRPFYRYGKLVLLTFCWIIFTAILMFKGERVEIMHQISVLRNETINYNIYSTLTNREIGITVEGSLLRPFSKNTDLNVSDSCLIIWLDLSISEYQNTSEITFKPDTEILTNLTEPWILPLLPEDLVDVFPHQRHSKVFQIKNVDEETLSKSTLILNLRTNTHNGVSLMVSYDLSPMNADYGVIFGAIVLIGLYILIIFEAMHRAIAAMLASTMSIAILAALNERPTMSELISWIDVDTLLLLFSMMVLVAIVAETGIFDWLSVYAFKITGGRLWPLVNTLCFFTAFISAFLDNVTTVLLMTPVTIRLCEVMELNPVPILTAMVLYSNIGGAITPVGDPPNVIIASNRDVINSGVNFSTFSLHMGIGVFLVLIVVYAQLRFVFRDVAVLRFDEPQDVQELRHEIAIWQRAAASLSSYSKDENLVRETLLKKVRRLFSQLKMKLMTGSVALDKYKTTLDELQEKYPIRDTWLLIKSGFVLLFVITLFFLHSVPELNLSLGWTALLGVLLLLILADGEDLDGLMARVEWSTLLFFASLFILMEALSRLGLIAWIGNLTESLILSVSEESRLAVAILLLLWISALASAFVDNVPLTTMMVRIVSSLAENHELGLPLQPLVWALAFGACMGGNATLIGATANVVCAGVAEQHGYKFTFMQFFKVGFPVMLTSTATITMYLMLAHVVFNWN
ncbi:P protein isoform X2 [Prorops nasuta]|uniref:P protein isoform X2 n=1 Tax=Prorops nasuta TaxID=863751 RepID=UPI0034CDC685